MGGVVYRPVFIGCCTIAVFLLLFVHAYVTVSAVHGKHDGCVFLIQRLSIVFVYTSVKMHSIKWIGLISNIHFIGKPCFPPLVSRYMSKILSVDGITGCFMKHRFRCFACQIQSNILIFLTQFSTVEEY